MSISVRQANMYLKKKYETTMKKVFSRIKSLFHKGPRITYAQSHRLACIKLSGIASMKIQQKYMVNATKDYYFLPSDAMNDAYHVAESVTKNYPWAKKLKDHEKKAILKFGDILNQQGEFVDTQDTPWDELVNQNPHWDKIRSAAQQCLASLEFNLNEYETEELKTETS
ncbi:hypothetical protein ACFL02_03555 [Planctomycetota bacterium]